MVAEQHQGALREAAEQVRVEVPLGRGHHRRAGEVVRLHAAGGELLGPAQQVGSAAGERGDVGVGVPQGERRVRADAGLQRVQHDVGPVALLLARSVRAGATATGSATGCCRASGRSPASSCRRGAPDPTTAGGCPGRSPSSASSTAGSTTQVRGTSPADEPKSASRDRRPSGAVRCTQRVGPLRLPSAARRARSRTGSTTDSGTVCSRASDFGTNGMNVRARPSASRSRPSGLVPRACTPIQ